MPIAGSPALRPVARASPVADGSVVLTGRGDDAAWTRTRPAAWDSDYAGRPTGIVTRARFLYSRSALYVLWELESTGLNVDRSRAIDVPRKNLYEEDCVELFLAPDTADPAHYYELEQGPFGHFWDLDIDRRAGRSDDRWSSRACIATTSDATKRTATIECAIVAPEIVRALTPGARLPMGLYRMEGKEPRAYLAWSPPRTVKPSFHEPEAFGTLVLDPVAPPSLLGAALR
jgi:hypothetical protein